MKIYCKIFGSMPNFVPRLKPSTTEFIWIPRIRLLQILAISPLPGPPQLNKFLPMPSRTGLHYSNSPSLLQPTMNVRVPLWAPMIPPDIGVSQKRSPCSLDSSWNFFEAIGEMVLVSQITVPFFALLKIPPSMVSTFSTLSVLGRAVTTKSTSLTASATLAAGIIPYNMVFV